MTFGAGGEEADRHMLIRDEELRDYLNEAERRCSRVALESLVPMLPDDPTIQFNRHELIARLDTQPRVARPGVKALVTHELHLW